MSQDTLTGFVEATAGKFGIPGVAAGVWVDGQELYACQGVASTDNPLPVDQDTLYVLGSVTKTYTATALMRPLWQRWMPCSPPPAATCSSHAPASAAH